MAEKTTQDSNVEVVRRLIDEVWSQGKMEVAEELVTTDYVENDPALTDLIEGREAFKENVAGFREILVEGKEIETIVASGDRVAVEYTYTGTHEGELWETDPTGNEVSAKGMFFFELEDGKISSCTHLWDAYGTLKQIEAIPESTEW